MSPVYTQSIEDAAVALYRVKPLEEGTDHLHKGVGCQERVRPRLVLGPNALHLQQILLRQAMCPEDPACLPAGLSACLAAGLPQDQVPPTARNSASLLRPPCRSQNFIRYFMS